MRTFLLTIFLAVVFPMAAAAQINAPKNRYAAKVLSCNPVDDPYTASFRGSMRVFKGAQGLEMLQSLQTLNDDGKFASAGAPGFDQWVPAKHSPRRYISDKTLKNLSPGATYRLMARFRWHAADGTVVATASATSKPCHVQAPNLNVVGLSGGPVDAATGQRTYVFNYLNDGDADSGEFGVDLSVGGAALAEQSDILAAGEKGSTTFFGPACAAGTMLVATLDPAGLVLESNEADNRYELPCPNVTAQTSP